MSALNGFMGYHSIALDFQLLSPSMNGSVPFCNAWARAANMGPGRGKKMLINMQIMVTKRTAVQYSASVLTEDGDERSNRPRLVCAEYQQYLNLLLLTSAYG